ncbi:YceI family protein [Sulfurimonas sp.]|nr:YceI family protein [Sulfurimonas sp.]
MIKLLLVLCFSIALVADSLNIKNGVLKAHTEMMMDSNIDPINKNLHAHLTIRENDLTTIEGVFWVEMNMFASDESDRDEAMHESIKSSVHKLAIYKIFSVTKTEIKDIYEINGVLSFQGIDKDLVAEAKIVQEMDSMSINATTSMQFSDYGIEMPCLLFMCVDDMVDLNIQASFDK